MKFSLAKKFKAFVANLEGYENLDLLLKNTREGRRGDYLFRRRVIVAEQKEQNSEASVAWDNYVKEGYRLGQKYNINVQTNVLPIELLSTDERRNFFRLKRKYTRRFEKYLSDADDQIANTKKICKFQMLAAF